MDVGEYFCLHPTTTHAAVAYLDRLHLSKFSRHEWQMLAVSCILIAGEEYDLDPDRDPGHSLACSCDTFLQIQMMPHLRQLKLLNRIMVAVTRNDTNSNSTLDIDIFYVNSPLFEFTFQLSAAKYNEKEEDVPDLLTLESILKQPIPNEILLKYEMWALQKMGWKLNGTYDH